MKTETARFIINAPGRKAVYIIAAEFARLAVIQASNFDIYGGT